MKEMIIYQNGQPLIEPKTAVAIAEMERELKALKEKAETAKKALLQAMEANNVRKLQTPELSITYIAPTTRESFNTKLFRETCPDLYDDFVEIKDVASSIRVKLA